MEQQINEIRRRNELLREKAALLDEEVELYQQLHGDDLDKYPAHVREYATRQAAQGRRSKRPRDPDDDDDEGRNDSFRERTSAPSSLDTSSESDIPWKATWRPKVVEPDLYYGKSQCELDEFICVCEWAFDHNLLAFH